MYQRIPKYIGESYARISMRNPYFMFYQAFVNWSFLQPSKSQRHKNPILCPSLWAYYIYLHISSISFLYLIKHKLLVPTFKVTDSFFLSSCHLSLPYLEVNSVMLELCLTRSLNLLLLIILHTTAYTLKVLLTILLGYINLILQVSL